MSVTRYAIGWVTPAEWDRGDGEFDMQFDGCGFDSLEDACGHADAIARSNHDFVFVVIDEMERGNDPIKYIARRDKPIRLRFAGVAT